MLILSRAVVFLLLCIFVPTFSFAIDKIDINTATPKQLDDLVGIGPKYAQAIIGARPFFSVDDLIRVKGIGEKTLQKIKDQGLACVNCQISATAYPVGIVFNELLPSPQGADETEEWFEVFNSNNFDVDLSGWQVKDSAGIITTFTIPKDTKISANGFLVFKRPETKITLNNDGDGLKLLTPEGKEIDLISYENAPLGESYSHEGKSWFWSASPTPGSINKIVSPIKEETKEDVSLKEQGSSENEKLAAISGPFTENKQKPKSFTAPLLALIISLFSGIVILTLKKHVRAFPRKKN
jgi:competence ComEA-like helix-hairpin-helix protein